MTCSSAAAPPAFVQRSPLLDAAYRLAVELHHGPRRRGDTDIEHPLRVAALLDAHEFGDQVVAAALLHDVIEDTDTDIAEIAARFGPQIAELVAEMTEDEGIDAYPARKAEHRARVARDPQVAAIYAADKLANAETLNQSDEGGSTDQIQHYLHTLVLLEREQPDLPFLGPLRDELIALGEAD